MRRQDRERPAGGIEISFKNNVLEPEDYRKVGFSAFKYSAPVDSVSNASGMSAKRRIQTDVTETSYRK
jgi:hypothetical protein